MDATTTLSIPSLLTRLTIDYPSFFFVASNNFHWSPDEQTIYYDTASSDYAALLHEVGHAVLAHRSYKKDIQLLEMERSAWEYARLNLGTRYGLVIDNDTIQDALDTYRDWLHDRSTCPYCQAIGLQNQKNTYKCLACSGCWYVNEARRCALRRYKLPPNTKTPS